MKKRTAMGDRIGTAANEVNAIREFPLNEVRSKVWREERLRQRSLELAIDALATGHMTAETTVVSIAEAFYKFLNGDKK